MLEPGRVPEFRRASQVISPSPLYTPRRTTVTLLPPPNGAPTSARVFTNNTRSVRPEAEVSARLQNSAAPATLGLNGSRIINDRPFLSLQVTSAERRRSVGIVGIPAQDHADLLEVLVAKCGAVERTYPHGEDSSSLYVIFRDEESVGRASLLTHVYPVRGQFFSVERCPHPYPTRNEVNAWRERLRLRDVDDKQRRQQISAGPLMSTTAHESMAAPAEASTNRPALCARSRFLTLQKIPFVGDFVVPILEMLLPPASVAHETSEPLPVTRKRPRDL